MSSEYHVIGSRRNVSDQMVVLTWWWETRQPPNKMHTKPLPRLGQAAGQWPVAFSCKMPVIILWRIFDLHHRVGSRQWGIQLKMNNLLHLYCICLKEENIKLKRTTFSLCGSLIVILCDYYLCIHPSSYYPSFIPSSKNVGYTGACFQHFLSLITLSQLQMVECAVSAPPLSQQNDFIVCLPSQSVLPNTLICV